MTPYDLWYWPGIPGRGEFVRLALEAGGIPYRDRAREDGVGEEGLMADMAARRPKPFAPPYLVAGELVIAQTANILLFLGDEHGLAPEDRAGRLLAHQYQLTVADIVAEAHDTHHPVALDAYYEDQKPEAARRAASFREARIPKFLGWFEQALDGREWLVGNTWSYADLSLFQLVEGLDFAFPKRMAAVADDIAGVRALHGRVKALPSLAGYLASDRRIPFGDGIFRHYPALDRA
ncbi:glutathione S-transferase family protein [Sphingomonas quercus]|uniref:Glutathione S-transferase n=1 Tax=Sphingomonas quercus TaxID=2842451 RepID=A0ABS6BF95_9SPHN|nr:glutathione S-transferase [Sphingomonas quercus]MBU3076970.1 glutathione S-transferase [Sphingomonas quercus]